MNEINFEFLYLLFLFPFALICLKYCKKKEDLLLFPTLQFIQESKKKLSILTILKILLFFFLSISLASPYVIKEFKIINKKAISIVLAIDISGSMKDDFKEVKKVVKDFIQKRDLDEIGVILFADSASIASPLTSNKDFLKQLLDSVKVGDLGWHNTTLNDAIILSTSLLKEAQTKTKLLILLTDGVEKGSHFGYRKVKEELKKSKIKIISIGFGNEYDKRYLKSLKGDLIEAKDKKELRKIFKKIDKMYKSKIKSKEYIQKKLLYQIPLFFSFLILLLYVYFSNKRSML